MKLYIRILGFLIICLLLWFLYNYLSKNNIETNLSPIDRWSLKYDREKVYEFDNILIQNEFNKMI